MALVKLIRMTLAPIVFVTVLSASPGWADLK